MGCAVYIHSGMIYGVTLCQGMTENLGEIRFPENCEQLLDSLSDSKHDQSTVCELAVGNRTPHLTLRTFTGPMLCFNVMLS